MAVPVRAGEIFMPAQPVILLPLAAVGYSLVYLLLGGGFFGAVVIFIIAKLLRK